MKGRALWLADVFRAAGLTVVEEPGWRTAGKAVGLDWAGIIEHHTASITVRSDHQSLGTVTKGRPDLAPPLCNWYICRAHHVHVVASGKANHAGVGTWLGLTSSTRLFGCEIEHTGYPPGVPLPPGAQAEEWSFWTVATAATADAAVLRHIGATSGHVCAHFEFARPVGRKPDPRGWDMAFYRRLVADQLTPAPAPRPAPAPAPPASGGAVHFEEADVEYQLVELAPKGYGIWEGWWNPGLGPDPLVVGVTLHGPSIDADGPWPWSLGATVRAQARGSEIFVVAAQQAGAPNPPGDRLHAHVTAAPR